MAMGCFLLFVCAVITLTHSRFHSQLYITFIYINYNTFLKLQLKKNKIREQDPQLIASNELTVLHLKIKDHGTMMYVRTYFDSY